MVKLYDENRDIKLNFSKFVKISFYLGLLHFICENVFHLIWGQFLPMLLVDYCASLLLFYACYESNKNKLYSLGIFCGGWGFSFCNFYRSFFGRIEIYLDGHEVQFFAVVYTGIFMLISAVLLGYSFWFMKKNIKGT